jgi:L-iditol 2-dehydrogenase
MLTSQLTSTRSIEWVSQHEPNPGSGDVLVKLTQVGICGSDVHLFTGERSLEYPQTIGHEGIGIIEKTGAGVSMDRVGQRVVIEPNIPCGVCRFCQNDRGDICPDKKVIGLNQPGCFAEKVVISSEYAWSLTDTVSDEDAVTIEPMSVAYHALHVAGINAPSALVVIGLGAIGQLISHLSVEMGHRVIAFDLNEQKLHMAASLGVEAHAVSGDFDQQTSLIRKILSNVQASTIFECAGAASTATLAMEIAPRGSKVVMTGLSTNKAFFQPLRLVREGITIIPSLIYHHPTDFQAVIRLIELEKIHPGRIISSYEPLINLQTALERAASGGETKVVIKI